MGVALVPLMAVATQTRTLIFALALLSGACGTEPPPPLVVERAPSQAETHDALPAMGEWADACKDWHRRACAKATACGRVANPECALTDDELLVRCQQDVGFSGCGSPSQSSFEQCEKDADALTCDEVCGAGDAWCLSFCNFSCETSD